MRQVIFTAVIVLATVVVVWVLFVFRGEQMLTPFLDWASSPGVVAILSLVVAVAGGLITYVWRSANKKPKAEAEVIYDGRTLWLEVHNAGHGSGAFQVQTLSWDGIEITLNGFKLSGPRNLRWWVNNASLPNEPKHMFDADEQSRVILLENGGAGSTPTDPIQYQNFELTNTFERNIPARALRNSDVKVRIRITSTPELESRFERTYTLHVDEKGVWTSGGTK